jgi:hypothetical protein
MLSLDSNSTLRLSDTEQIHTSFKDEEYQPESRKPMKLERKKIVVVGDGAIGKTCFLGYYLKKSFLEVFLIIHDRIIFPLCLKIYHWKQPFTVKNTNLHCGTLPAKMITPAYDLYRTQIQMHSCAAFQSIDQIHFTM